MRFPKWCQGGTVRRVRTTSFGVERLEHRVVMAGGAAHYAQVAAITVPGKPLTSFDISFVDSARHRLYFADRANGSVDIIDTTTNKFVGRIPGFVGISPGGREVSGPPSATPVGRNELWVSDGNSTVKVVKLNKNHTGGTIVDTISTGGKARADEAAYDPRDGIYLVNNNADSPAFATMISTATRQIIAKIPIPSATSGLEQPVYDPGTHKFLVSVPNLNGELHSSAVAVVDPKTFAVSFFPVPDSEPAGLALGPKEHLLLGSDGTPDGLPSVTPIISAIDGHIIAQVTQVGGSDEVWYNPGDHHYYLAASDQPGGPVLGVIDAKTNRWIENVPTGFNSHSVAADAGNRKIFVPLSPTSSDSQGGIGVFELVHGK